VYPYVFVLNRKDPLVAKNVNSLSGCKLTAAGCGTRLPTVQIFDMDTRGGLDALTSLPWASVTLIFSRTGIVPGVARSIATPASVAVVAAVGPATIVVVSVLRL